MLKKNLVNLATYRKVKVRIFQYLLLAFFVISCASGPSFNQSNSRSLASSSTTDFCRKIVQNLFDSKNSVRAPDYSGFISSDLKILKGSDSNSSTSSHPRDVTRGIGMMIYPGRSRSSALTAEGRLFPYLSISKEEVDELFN